MWGWVVLSPDMTGTYTIPDVEILRTGEWNGREYTVDDLDNIAEAHEQLSAAGVLIPRVTIDHDERKTRSQGDGGPALGFVQSVRRVGDRLLATLEKVPALLADAIKRGNYGPRSVEVWFHNAFGGQEFPAVLTALSFLGADLPGVEGLAEIAQLYEEPATLAKPVSGAQRHVAVMSAAALSKDEEPEMDPSILQALGLGESASVEDVVARCNELGATSDAVAKVREAMGLGADDDVVAAVAELTTETETETADTAEQVVEVAALRKDNAALLARVAKLEHDNAKKEAEVKVDGLIRAGKLLPAGKDEWVAHLTRDPDSFAKLSKGLPQAVPVTELGHSGGSEADPYALTADEREAVKRTPGLTEEAMYHEKLRRAGQPIPAKKKES